MVGFPLHEKPYNQIDEFTSDGIRLSCFMEKAEFNSVRYDDDYKARTTIFKEA
jgi:hypothetical protein